MAKGAVRLPKILVLRGAVAGQLGVVQEVGGVAARGWACNAAYRSGDPVGRHVFACAQDLQKKKE